MMRACHSTKQYISSILLGMLALGCTLHEVPLEHAPLVQAPGAYSVEPVDSEVPAGDWWTVFEDETLDHLVETALAQNLTIAQAMERVQRAQHLWHQADALRKPQVDLSGDVERSWRRDRLKNVEPPAPDTTVADVLRGVQALQDTIQNGPSGGGSGGGGGDPDTSFDRTPERYSTDWGGSLALRWEVDLWGRLRSEAVAREALISAALEDYEALRLFISSLVVEAYYQAMEQRLQFELLQEQRQSAQNTLELLELRFLQSAASVVDVLQQRGQLARIDGEVPSVEAELRFLENRLDVLVGAAPDGIDRTADREAFLPEETALPMVGVPLDQLNNRPDLRALHQQVMAADHRIASAIAERYPRITLDGVTSYSENADVGTIGVSGAASLLQPVWDWGLRKAAVEEAKSIFRESLLAYSEAYLIALEEVETTLWQELRQRELIEILAQREEILLRTVDETGVRYSLGATDYLPVLTALQDLQQLQRELLRQRRVLVSFRIALYRATGGPLAPVEDLTLAAHSGANDEATVVHE
jgi:outer membrane protein TolC